jgi:hypothetical protein
MTDEKDCQCDNPAVASEMNPNAGPAPRVAEVEVCDNRVCETAHFLVRGESVSFVSMEQIQRVGEHKLDPVSMPSDPDLIMPSTHVLVNDAAGRLLNKCDIYVVKWRNSRQRGRAEIDPTDLAVAEDYFGTGVPPRVGFIDIPRGPWKRVARVRFIRYSRHGANKPYEHRYDPPVYLLYCARPLAWSVPLPDGCVIDSRGFVRP